MTKQGKNQTKKPNIAINRRASFDFKLGEEITAGMVLSGPEVRLIRDHHVQLKGSFVTLHENELWLNNLTLGSETARNIKLLVTKKQLNLLERSKQSGMTIVPTKLFGDKRYIKINVAIAEGKKKYDKRHAIKQKDLDRENKRRMF